MGVGGGRETERQTETEKGGERKRESRGETEAFRRGEREKDRDREGREREILGQVCPYGSQKFHSSRPVTPTQN